MHGGSHNLIQFYKAKNCMSKIQQKQRKVLKSRLFVRVRVRAR